MAQRPGCRYIGQNTLRIQHQFKECALFKPQGNQTVFMFIPNKIESLKPFIEKDSRGGYQVVCDEANDYVILKRVAFHEDEKCVVLSKNRLFLNVNAFLRLMELAYEMFGAFRESKLKHGPGGVDGFHYILEGEASPNGYSLQCGDDPRNSVNIGCYDFIPFAFYCGDNFSKIQQYFKTFGPFEEVKYDFYVEM